MCPLKKNEVGSAGEKLATRWFSRQGWQPLPFQKKTWEAFGRGESGLLHMPTGAGKTYAAYFGPLAKALESGTPGTKIIYITPLRALSRDIELALKAPAQDLNLPVTVESRTGDTTSSTRSRQKKNPPHVLVTTPESLSLLTSYPDAHETFRGVQSVIVDEWHEL
jgi:ATP-dependent Lhr-like helicase